MDLTALPFYWSMALHCTCYRYSQGLKVISARQLSHRREVSSGVFGAYEFSFMSLVSILKFGWISENWLKFWNWVKILKWGWNSVIWSKVWNLLKMMRRTFKLSWKVVSHYIKVVSHHIKVVSRHLQLLQLTTFKCKLTTYL